MKYSNARTIMLAWLIGTSSVVAVAGELSDKVTSAFENGLAQGGCRSFQDAAELLASSDAAKRMRGQSCLAALKQLRSNQSAQDKQPNK